MPSHAKGEGRDTAKYSRGRFVDGIGHRRGSVEQRPDDTPRQRTENGQGYSRPANRKRPECDRGALQLRAWPHCSSADQRRDSIRDTISDHDTKEVPFETDNGGSAGSGQCVLGRRPDYRAVAKNRCHLSVVQNAKHLQFFRTGYQRRQGVASSMELRRDQKNRVADQLGASGERGEAGVDLRSARQVIYSLSCFSTKRTGTLGRFSGALNRKSGSPSPIEAWAEIAAENAQREQAGKPAAKTVPPPSSTKPKVAVNPPPLKNHTARLRRARNTGGGVRPRDFQLRLAAHARKGGSNYSPI